MTSKPSNPSVDFRQRVIDALVEDKRRAILNRRPATRSFDQSATIHYVVTLIALLFVHMIIKNNVSSNKKNGRGSTV